MRRFFTKNLFLMVLSLAAIDMMGQAVNKLKITAPAGVAGEYNIERFLWGPIKTTALSGVADFGVDATAPVNDGCTALTNNLTGKIGFIDRGICGISDKALNAEKAGAIAVIICNTPTGTPATAVGSGAGANNLKISAYMMSNADCAKIRASILAGGVSMELFATPPPNCDITYDPDVFWGNQKGQGDFNNGLNGWTVENLDPALDSRTVWFHSETGFPRSATGFSSNDIKSKSKCNGTAVMDIRVQQEIDNPTLAQPYVRYTSSLVSPPIDCRGKNTIILQFSMLHNRLNGNALISFFDGTTWSDAREIATTNAVNASAEKEDVIYALPEFANKENCRIRFTVNNADFYYFVLDDVMLLNKAVVDVRVNKGWVATVPSYKTPKDQVSDMVFMADIENVGNTSANSVVLNVEVKNEAGNVVGSLDNVYGNVDGATIVENSVFADSYIPPAVPGNYTGQYNLGAANETANSQGNNTADFEFVVTEKTFGAILSEDEFGSEYLEDITGSWAVSDLTPYYSAGNVYYVEKGDGYTVENVRFGLANDPAAIDGSGFVFVDLYEMSSIQALQDPEGRTLVGTGEILIENLPDLRNVELPIFEPDDAGAPSEKSVKLKDNTTYFLTVHSAPLDPSTDRYEFLQYSGRGTAQYDLSVYPAPTNFALDSVYDRFSGSYWQRAGLDNSYEDMRTRSYARTGNEGFGSWAVPYLEMDVIKSNSTYDIAKTGEANIFPNPASREMYIDVTLENTSKELRVDLITIDGKVALTKSFTNVQDSRLKLDLSGLTSGTYTAMIHTDNGVIAKKVVVQK